MFRDIIGIINELRSVGSSNDKKAILKIHESNLNWRRFLLYVYDEVGKVYGKTKLPVIPSLNESLEHSIIELYDIMDMMASGDLSGKDADNALCDLLVGADEDYVELAGLILKRDIKAKVGATMLNDVYGHNFIHIPPYMRCEKEEALTKRIKYPCYGQTKEDGLFLNVELWTETGEAKTSVRITTRQGFEMKPIPSLFSALGLAYGGLGTGFVIHGEALILGIDGNYWPRAAGNGLINSYVQQDSTRKRKLKDIESAKSAKAKAKLENELAELENKWLYCANNIVYVAWDIVDRLSWKNLRYDFAYEKRLELLRSFVTGFRAQAGSTMFTNRLQVVETVILYNEEEVMEYYASKLENKQEGIVVKNFDLIWEHDKTTHGMIKLKDFKECDLMIVGFTHGKPNTQFELGVGSYYCESSCGRLIVNVSGLTMEQRGYERVDPNNSALGIKLIDGFDPEENMGCIAAVKFNEVIQKKGVSTKSLNLPSILEIRARHDKSVAETLEEIEGK